jgi:hypothetical protein
MAHRQIPDIEDLWRGAICARQGSLLFVPRYASIHIELQGHAFTYPHIPCHKHNSMNLMELPMIEQPKSITGR